MVVASLWRPSKQTRALALRNIGWPLAEDRS
jgi:hypothetical protein